MKRFRLLAGGAAAAIVASVVLPAQAGAPQSVVVSEDPVDWTPTVVAGSGVWGVAEVGDMTVVGGTFTTVSQRAPVARTVTRNNIFAFDSTGQVSDTFVPTIGNRIWDIIPAGDGQSVYVGGQFSSVNGAPRTNRVARICVASVCDVDPARPFTQGQVMTTFRSPSPAIDGKVMDLQLANGRLYVGGYFSNVGGQPRTALAALDPTTGADTGYVNLRFSDVFRVSTNPRIPSGYNGVGIERFTMSPDGTKLVAVGNFRTVTDLSDASPVPQSRVQIAMVDTSGPQAKLSSWSTDRFSMACSASFPTYITGVDPSPDGQYFAITTGGAFNGGATSGTMCDSASRWEFAGSGPGQQPTWVDYLGGDSGTAVQVTGTAIYIGGHYRWANNPYAADRVGPGTVKRAGLAALDPRNGLPLSWKAAKTPLRWGVMRFASTSQGLWIGHDADTIADEPTGMLALMPTAGGETLPADVTGSLPGNAYLLGKFASPGDDDDVFRNSLGTMPDGSTVATGSAEIGNGGVDWSSSRGAFMVDGRLYNGWANGTFTWRPFFGSTNTFGTARNINLNGLTAFSSELPNIRGMWFDRSTGRMYFTMSGQDVLYYRYFTPESLTVGAVRFTASGSDDVDWGSVRGGFLANGRLYFSNADGTLRSLQWQNGPVTGTTQTVSGPAVDGFDWSSGSLFLRAQ